MSELEKPVKNRVKKHRNYLFANKGTAEAPVWIRVRTATDFAVSFNPETESFDYIGEENPTEELKSYKPVIAQTQTAYIGDSVFDYIFDFAYGQKTGTEAITQGMVVFQQPGETPDHYKAWLFDMGVTIDTYDVVSGTLSYQMSIRGNIEKGQATLNADEEPVFVRKPVA